MEAIYQTEYGGAEVLQRGTQPKPEPGAYDVVVENRAIGVNPIDFKVRNGVLNGPVDGEHPLIVGWDGSGVVASVGSAITRFVEGDEVYYAGDVTRAGSYAAYTAVDSRAVAKKPASLSWVQAAAIPLAAETAWETLVEEFGVKKGDSVLVYNGAGGVGSIAIQLARIFGVTVIASASREETREWCKKMGADHLVNHSSQTPMLDQLKALGFEKGVDYIFHLHEPENLPQMVKCLRPLGQIALTWVPSPEAMAKVDSMDMFMKRQGIRYTLMFTRLAQGVQPEMQGELLEKVAAYFDEGKMCDVVTKTLSWKDVKDAHAMQESGKSYGKIVMMVE